MYAQNVLISLDQLLNALLAGDPDETLSARAWRLHQRKRRWAIARYLIDKLFFWQDNHCFEAHFSELMRKHLPAGYHTESIK